MYKMSFLGRYIPNMTSLIIEARVTSLIIEARVTTYDYRGESDVTDYRGESDVILGIYLGRRHFPCVGTWIALRVTNLSIQPWARPS